MMSLQDNLLPISSGITGVEQRWLCGSDHAELPVRFTEGFHSTGPISVRFGLVSSVKFDIMTMYSELSYGPWFPTFDDFGLFLGQDNVLLRHTVL